MRAVLSFALIVLGAALAVSACAQEPVELGRKYFMDSGCYGCHVVGNVGTLPTLELSAQQVKAVAAFLASLR